LKEFLKYYFTLILYTWSFFDVITGYNLHNETLKFFNIALFTRTILLFLSIVIIFLKSDGYLKYLFSLISLIYLLLFCKLIYYKYPFDYFYMQIKTFSWIFNTFAFFLLFKSNILTYNTFKNALYINFLIICFNILFGYFGFGYAKYGEDADGSIIGSIGYFYSGNELNSALFLCFSIFYYLYRKSFRKFVYSAIIFLILTFATLSKSIIVGYIFITIISLYHLHQKMNLKTTLILLFTTTFLFFTLTNINYIKLYFESFSFLYQKSDTFFEFISNGRNLRFNAFEITNFFSNYSYILFGTYHPDNNIFTFEMDYLDIFFYNGIFGILLVILCWKFYFKLISNTINSNENKYFIKVLFFYNLIAFFAGHTLYSQMSFLFLVILVMFSYEKSQLF
jgi:hypothetical protein